MMCLVQVSKHSGPVFLGFGVVERRGGCSCRAIDGCDLGLRFWWSG